MGRLTTTFEGISYTHRLLWEIAEEQANLARERERGWVNFSLISATFAFHALEAYVNFAGERLAPDLWADERNSFTKNPYRGWKGKLRKVCELTNVPWTENARPLKTVFELQALRDAIAHGKAERFAYSVEHDDDDGAGSAMPNAKIRALVLPKARLDDVLHDVRALFDQMHPAVAAAVDDPFSEASAVDGAAAWWTSSTSLT